MAVRETLDKIEEFILDSMHMPLTGRILVDEDKLTQLIEEFRQELPQELGHAEKIIQERENIIQAAKQEADSLIKKSQEQAERLVDENDVVLKAREKARLIETQAHQQSNEIVESAKLQARQFQEGVERYAIQVFDNLIANTMNTCNGIQAAESNLKQSLQILQQSKIALKQQSYANAKQQSYNTSQNQNYNTAQNYNAAQPQNYQTEQNPQVQDYSQNPQNPQS